MSLCRSCFVCCLFVVLAESTFRGSALATPLSVDGSVGDWGFSVADNNKSTFVPKNNIGLIQFTSNDYNDNSGHVGWLGTGTGGQDFDVEALAAAVQSNTLYVTLVSGQRPDNGYQYFAPGDFRIVTSGGVYGLESGGGKGGGSGTAITEGATGWNYYMDGDGFTKLAYQTPLSQQVAGSLWFNPQWDWAPDHQVQFEAQANQYVATADYVFTRNSATQQHSVIEWSLPLSVFGNNRIEGIYWQEACDNDKLSLAVPEPSALVLSLAALATVAITAGRKRRRRTSA